MTEETIFATALAKPTPAERVAYLDAACGDDRALRQRVEGLLRAHDQAGDFLGHPAVERAAAGDSSPSGATQPSVRPPQATPAPALAPEPGPGQETPTELPAAGDGDALGFLAPPRQPGALGRLDHYAVLEIVGQGGMGVVLRAFDEKLHRVVAIKTLAPQLATSALARKRFVREAQAAAAVGHEHVIDIHAVEDTGTVPYLVMQYVHGVSLEAHIQQAGALGVKEILRIGLQVAEGLAAAHRQGLVHRDVKPANILLENGVQRVKLTDFGLARAVDDASLTGSGYVAGTPMYMAPEQARGEPVDHRADLFSLGSVLYTMCTGRPPFRAETALAVLKRVCEDTPRPIREVNPDIPEWLTAIVFRLHAKDPAQRFQSAAEVAALLSLHLAHLQGASLAPLPPVPAARPEPTPSAAVKPTLVQPGVGRAGAAASGVRPARRRSLTAALAILLMAAGAAGIWLLLHRLDAGRITTRDAPENGDAPGKPADVVLDLRREDIPPNLLGLAGGGDPARAPAELAAVLADDRFRLPPTGECGSPVQSDDGKLLAAPTGNTVVLFDAHTGARLQTLTGLAGPIVRVAFSPDGKHLAAGDSTRAAIRIWDVASGKSLRTLEAPAGAIFRVAYSPDGKHLASHGHDESMVRVWDVDGGKEAFHLEGHKADISDLAYSPDGQRIFTSSFDKTVKVWDAQTGKELHTVTGHKRPVLCLALSRDGKLLASGDENHCILWDAQKLQPIRTHPRITGWLAFAPDSRTLLAAGRLAYHDQSVTRWDAATGDPLPPMTVKQIDGWASHHLGPDGKTLWVVANNVPDGVVHAYDTDTGQERLAPEGHTGPVKSVAVSPDGRTLASGGADCRVLLWDLATRRITRVLTGHTEEVRALAFSADGKRLASGSPDATIRVWDVPGGDQVQTFKGTHRIRGRLAWSPDGRTLATGSEEGEVCLWDLESGKETRTPRGHSAPVRAVAFSPDGRLLVSGGEEGKAILGAAASSKPFFVFTLKGAVHDVGVSPDGQFLAAVTAAPDAALHLWDITTRQEAVPQEHHHDVLALAFQPKGRVLATAAADGAVRLWDSQAGCRPLTAFGPGPFGNAASVVAFTPDGRYLAAAGANGSVALLRVPAVGPAYTCGPPRPLPEPAELARRPSPADALKREAIPEELLAKAGGGDARRAPVELVGVLHPHEAGVCGVAISPDGKWLASASLDKTVKLWDLATGRLRHTLTGHDIVAYSVAFSPDSRLLASCSTKDLTVRIWDVVAGKGLHTLTAPTGVAQVAFTPDGSLLAAATWDGSVRLYDPHTGSLRRVLRKGTQGVWCVAFSPDGKTLAAGGADQRVHLWDVATGWEVATLPGQGAQIRCVAFHPDGQSLASCGWGSTGERTVWLWDLTTLQEKQRLEGHLSSVLSCAWRADGRLLVSAGGEDGTVRLWEPGRRPSRCEALQLLAPGTVYLYGIALTPEGRYLATANPDGTVYVLRLADPGAVFRPPPS
jgi:WD40 repeat protein